MSKNCGCEPKRYNISLGCCVPVISPAENYYTKYQIDEMLDEIESAITSGCCITPEEVDEKIDEATSGLQQTLSAGTGIDITDNIISCTITGSGGCDCDLSDYVTFDDMAEYVGDVYTKTEVNNLFVTKQYFNTYIINLQQQIDSLKSAISGCCGSSGETEYRWIVVSNDYVCSGTTKMTKEKQQSSTDGINWTDTGQYRTGSTVLETNSVDCGYVPPTPSNYKVKAGYKRGYTVGSGQVECNSSTTLTQDEVKYGITFPVYFTSIEFGNCIDTIGEDAFVNVRTISSVTIPSNITTLKSCAFNNCGIESYVLNNGLTTIEHTAFISNYNLTTITIPSTVTFVGNQAFYNCTALTSVTFSGTTPPTFGTGIFNNCANLSAIYVPQASVDAYKAAWSEYAGLIQPIQ